MDFLCVCITVFFVAQTVHDMWLHYLDYLLKTERLRLKFSKEEVEDKTK